MEKNNLDPKKIKKTRENVEKYLKSNESLLKKYKLQSRVVISFPGKNNIPKIGKLAMWLLNKSGGIIDTKFTIKNKK